MIYFDIYIYPTPLYEQAGAVEYTDCNSEDKDDSSNKCPGYDTKQSDGEASVMLELWGSQNTPSRPSLPGLLGAGVVAPVSVLPMGQIDYTKQNCLKLTALTLNCVDKTVLIQN